MGTSTIARNDKVYSYTTIAIPLELKIKARDLGINFSKTVVNALEIAVKAREGSNAHNQP